MAVRSAPPSWGGDEAERVAGRIRVDMGVWPAQAGGTKVQDAFAGCLYVVDHDIKVHLLRVGRVRPAGRHMVRGALERKPGAVVIDGDDHKFLGAVRYGPAEQGRIKPCQGQWVRTVNHEVVQAPDHAAETTTVRVNRPWLPPGRAAPGVTCPSRSPASLS